MSSRFQASLAVLYLNQTWSKSMEPSSTWASGLAEVSPISGCSSSTSMIRLPQATDRVSIIMIMETIMRLMRTCVI